MRFVIEVDDESEKLRELVEGYGREKTEEAMRDGLGFAAEAARLFATELLARRWGLPGAPQPKGILEARTVRVTIDGEEVDWPADELMSLQALVNRDGEPRISVVLRQEGRLPRRVSKREDEWEVEEGLVVETVPPIARKP